MVCSACNAGFGTEAPPWCAVCAAPDVPVSPQKPVCSNCLLRGPFAFEEARATGPYAGTLGEAVRRLKYEGRQTLAKPLAWRMVQQIREHPFAPPHPTVVVPIPLHRSRLRERGFNQALMLAEEVSRQLGVPLCTDLLVRTRATQPQARMSREERLVNLRGAFAAVGSEKLRGAQALLVDDVITTLCTANAAAVALKEAGAAGVVVVAAARGG
jgi:ComF family protein